MALLSSTHCSRWKPLIHVESIWLDALAVDNLGQVDPIFTLHHSLVIELITFSLDEQRFVIQEYFFYFCFRLLMM
jgi:hypothetical protein